MRVPLPVARGDSFDLTEFLRAVDLTVNGIGEPELYLWADFDADGRIVGTTGFELDDANALIRSVAVDPFARGTGRGTELARFALEQAAILGATRAWLFSRRSGPFWQKLGFEPASAAELAAAVGRTHQLQAFVASGQLLYESAWSRSLP